VPPAQRPGRRGRGKKRLEENSVDWWRHRVALAVGLDNFRRLSAREYRQWRTFLALEQHREWNRHDRTDWHLAQLAWQLHNLPGRVAYALFGPPTGKAKPATGPSFKPDGEIKDFLLRFASDGDEDAMRTKKHRGKAGKKAPEDADRRRRQSKEFVEGQKALWLAFAGLDKDGRPVKKD
jgi:hypothetical protein